MSEFSRRDWLSTHVITTMIAVISLGAGCNTTVSSDLIPHGTAAGIPAASRVPSDGADIAQLEQVMLERINRARLRPGEEAAMDSIAIDEGVPGALDAHRRPPVAYNATLAQSARLHAEDMLTNNYFAHQDLSGGTPSKRIAAAGYSYSSTGENLAWNGTTGVLALADSVEHMHIELFADTGVAGRGHRIVMLHDGFREVGVSIRRGAFKQNNLTYDALMAVQDYATSAAARTFFVLGVVYQDFNNNHQYDAGEGTANVAVTLDGSVVTTTLAGGYTFEVVPGRHTLTFGSPGAPGSQPVNVAGRNVKVDLVNGTTVDVNLGLGEF